MSVDVLPSDETPPTGGRVGELLAKVAEALAEKDRLARLVTENNKRLDELEGLAVEAMKMEGVEGCRAAGKSWYFRDVVQVSVPADRREDVLKAARAAGLEEELVTVNTATLKAWLIERWKKAGSSSESVSDGTPFSGMVSEYRTVRLGYQTRG